MFKYLRSTVIRKSAFHDFMNPLVRHDIIWSFRNFVEHTGFSAWPTLASSFHEEVLIFLHVTSLSLFAASSDLSDVTPNTSFFDETSTGWIFANSVTWSSSVANMVKVFLRILSIWSFKKFELSGKKVVLYGNSIYDIW